MFDAHAKNYLHDDLRWIRKATLSKLDGLSEYDIRRTLTSTGTNLLGLIKHLSFWEARYFGEVFDRPFPEPLPRPELMVLVEPGSVRIAVIRLDRQDLAGGIGQGCPSGELFGGRPAIT